MHSPKHSVCACVFLCMCRCITMHIQKSRIKQLLEVSFLLLPCASQRLNSGYQVWWQSPNPLSHLNSPGLSWASLWLLFCDFPLGLHMLTTRSLFFSTPPSRDKSIYLDCPAYVSKAGLGLWILFLCLLSAGMTGMRHHSQTSQTFLSVLVSFCKACLLL